MRINGDTLVPFGYFDEAANVVPTFDPGTAVPCPVCGELVNLQPCVTISLLPAKNPKRSCFFRAHKSCWRGLTVSEQTDIESIIIDAEVTDPN